MFLVKLQCKIDRIKGRCKKNFNFIVLHPQCLTEVCDDVINILQSYGQADELGRDPGFQQLLVGKLAVGVGCRVEYAGIAVRHMGLNSNQLQRVDEAVRICPVPVHGESHYAAGAVREVLLLEGVIRVRRQVRVLDPFNGRAFIQEGRHLAGVAAMPFHTHIQGLKPQAQVECILRALDRSQIPHQLARCLGDICQFPEFLGVGESVIRRIRLQQM